MGIELLKDEGFRWLYYSIAFVAQRCKTFWTQSLQANSSKVCQAQGVQRWVQHIHGARNLFCWYGLRPKARMDSISAYLDTLGIASTVHSFVMIILVKSWCDEVTTTTCELHKESQTGTSLTHITFCWAAFVHARVHSSRCAWSACLGSCGVWTAIGYWLVKMCSGPGDCRCLRQNVWLSNGWCCQMGFKTSPLVLTLIRPWQTWSGPATFKV